jgi:hypothetical protein
LTGEGVPTGQVRVKNLGRQGVFVCTLTNVYSHPFSLIPHPSQKQSSFPPSLVYHNRAGKSLTFTKRFVAKPQKPRENSRNESSLFTITLKTYFEAKTPE